MSLSGRTTREKFINTIRTALDRSTSPPHCGEVHPPEVDESLVRLVPRLVPNPTDHFTHQATAAGMHVHHSTEQGLLSSLRQLLIMLQVRSAVLSVGDATESVRIRYAATLAGCRIVPWHGIPNLANHFDVDAGLTDCIGAVAETGSLILSSDLSRSRGAWLVPPIHVAILRSSQICADLIDAMPLVESSGPSSTVVFVTGPSKTADIEGILVTGVHGPGQVHILLVDECSA